MAPSPTIPTSFVPKQPVKSAARFTKSGGNVFLMFALFVLGLSILGAGGVFGYGEYLKSVEASKAEQLQQTELSINSADVEEFVRSRDRFETAQLMLDRHVAVSNFFDLLERITLVNVRYGAFSFGILEDGTAEITLAGSARSFNALAAQSTAFSSEKDVKRAIFSGIEVGATGAVGFTLEAELDADLLAFTAPAAPVVLPTQTLPAAPATTTTATTTTQTSAATSTAPQSPVTPPQL